jgi:glycosidase
VERDLGWVDEVIWWHVYPLGFVGAERERVDEVQHRLGRITQWLDYLVTLGANGLLLAPVFRSVSHGYDTLDHYRIDPRLGDDGDVEELLRAAARGGVRVLFDGVFNHVSRDHEIVRRALAAGPGSPDGAWIRWAGEHPYGFEGNLDLIELDLAHPGVQDYVVGVMDHWLTRGIDGWRLDAAYAAGPDAWRPILERVRGRHPGAWFLAEVIHGDYGDFVTRSGVDSVTQYELWKAVWSSLNDPNLHELAWALKRHAEMLETFVPQVFVGNHDVTRIATRLDDPRHLPAAFALLLLLPGVPSIYAGDEQGFTGEKTDGPGGDDAVRPAFPADPHDLAPNGERTFHEHQHLVHLRRTHPWLTTARPMVAQVTNDTIAIRLTGPDRTATLALNLSDAPLDVTTDDGNLQVAAHHWAFR